MSEIKSDEGKNNESVESKNVEDDFVKIDINPEAINPFGKVWSDIYKEIKEKSPFKNFQTYTIKNFIAKANDDLRQELLTMQLIKKFQEIFSQAEINLKLRPYEILITSSSSGLLEFLCNTNSIDGVKKKLPPGWDLNKFYRHFYKDSFEEAQKNFAESLAAYSLICYYLQIKDRHNGNILLDMKGSIIHIDFGFILGINPGNLNFESAPFKLTREYVDILDGLESPMFEYYKSLMIRGMIEAKQHVDTFVRIVEIMSRGKYLLTQERQCLVLKILRLP
jgi:phosphatidylinositol kinase/protein kinase (PI-3  family)